MDRGTRTTRNKKPARYLDPAPEAAHPTKTRKVEKKKVKKVLNKTVEEAEKKTISKVLKKKKKQSLKQLINSNKAKATKAINEDILKLSAKCAEERAQSEYLVKFSQQDDSKIQIHPVHEDNQNACDESNATNTKQALSDVPKLHHKCTERNENVDIEKLDHVMVEINGLCKPTQKINKPNTYSSRKALSEVQNLQQNVEGLRTSSQKSNGPRNSGSVSTEMQQRAGCSLENASVRVSTIPRKKRSSVNEYVTIKSASGEEFTLSKEFLVNAYRASTLDALVKNLAIGYVTPERVMNYHESKKNCDLENVIKLARLVLRKVDKFSSQPVAKIIRVGESLGMKEKNRIDPMTEYMGSSCKTKKERITYFSTALNYEAVRTMMSKGFKDYRSKNKVEVPNVEDSEI